MKSSRRSPRYRARFLTHTRMFLPQLQALLDEHQAHGYRLDDSWSFSLLCRGLCLKSAQEVGASLEGRTDAAHLSTGIFVTSGVSLSSTQLRPDGQHD